MPIQPYQIAPQPIAQTVQASDPSVSVNQGVTYSKTISGRRELFYKNDNGDVVQITSNGLVAGTAGAPAFEKLMINNTGAPIAMNKPVSIKPDGSIVLADSDAVDTQEAIGITLEAINDATAGRVALFGRNIAGALTGLGFAPGDSIFMDETAGAYTNSTAGFTGDNDSIVRIGVAAAANGITSVNATDLIMMREVLIRP